MGERKGKEVLADFFSFSYVFFNNSLQKENNRKFSSPAIYWCPHCTKNSFTDEEVGSFIMNYLLNLLKACGQVSSSTSSLALKRMLFRGKDFDGISTLANAEEIKRSLLGDASSNGEDTRDKQRKLKFEIQMKERELERVKSSGTDDSEKTDGQMDHLREAIKKLSEELQQLGNSVGTQSVPQVDYLKTCYDFYIQRNLYHLSDIDFSDCVKNIPFYDLKHFFQDVIKAIYVEGREIKAIAFRTEQEKDKIHTFS